ncbi:hypothetical protein ACIA8O_19815 [Kitasatospora sp. NPDC051853]|uniref:hypothetical protein n=1 Tax=Kitasatospora sp. NPDC051853 TaxID=3364058 RepID=UPI003788EAF3
MSDRLVQALEEAARRIGQRLGREAGHAVVGLYRQTGEGTRTVARRVVETDEALRREVDALAERFGSRAAVPPPRRGPDGASGAGVAEGDG